MDRETKKIILPLSKCEVEIITFLNWGEKEKIQDIIMSGAKIEDAQTGKVGLDAGVMLKSKYALLEVAIKNIKCGEEVKTYSKDWIDNLRIEDGDFLNEELEKLNELKKK